MAGEPVAPTPAAPERTSAVARWRVPAWAAIVLLYALIRLPLLDAPLDRDEGAFGVIGQALLRGEMPYRDICDNKPPGLFLLYALMLCIVPPSAVGVHGFLALWNFGSLLLAASIARTLAGEGAALAAGWLFAIASSAPSVQGFGATSEMLLLLPLLASIRLALPGERCHPPVFPEGNGGTPTGAASAFHALPYWRLAASGACGAFACWIKQPAALALLAAPTLILTARGRAASREYLRDALVWLAGGIAVSLVLCAPFVLAGVGGELWYWPFVHSYLYQGLASEFLAWRLGTQIPKLLKDHGLALAAAAWGLYRTFRSRRPWAWGLLVFCVGSLAAAFHSSQLYNHYFALLVPALALAGGLGWAAAAETLGAGRRTAFVLATALLLVFVPWTWRPDYWFRHDPERLTVTQFGRLGFDLSPRLAGYLKARMKPGETLFLYGSEPQIPFMGELHDLNPYVMVYPLTRAWPRHREFQERAWEAVARAQPVYIVVARHPTSLMHGPGTDHFLEDHLKALLAASYSLEICVAYRADAGYVWAQTPAEQAAAAALNLSFMLWRRKETPVDAQE